MKKITLSGNTFSIKEELKAKGFRWNPQIKVWYKIVEEAEEYQFDGVTVFVEEYTKADPNERKYFVKEGMIFNLESMHDKIAVIEIDIHEGKLSFPLEIANKEINDWGDLYDLKDEAEELEWKAKRGKVTGKEYGRIQQITAWRVMQRYVACIANGMEESKAAACFQDL